MNSLRPEPFDDTQSYRSTVDRHGGHHGGVGVLETRLPLRIIRGKGGQRRQVAACRSAGDCDEVGVPAVVGDVLLDPRQRPLDVDDVRGPGVARADPVVDRYANPSALGHVAQQRIGLRPPHADRPRSAGHLQQHGRLAVARQIGTAPDVGAVHAAVGSVLDGVGLLDVAAAHQLVGRDANQLASAGVLRLGGNPLVVVTERLAQRLLEVALRRRVAVHDQTEQRPGDRGQRQRDTPPRAAKVAPQATAGRVQQGTAQIQRRGLGGRPAEREHRKGDVTLAAQGPHTVGGVDEFGCRAQHRVTAFSHRGPS